MRKVLLAGIAILAIASVLAAQKQSALQTAADALGVAKIKTLQFTGSGQNFSVGQNYLPSEPWPPVPVKNYTAMMNFDSGSMRVDMLREISTPTMPRGGGAPFFGEQRQIAAVSGNYAWNIPPAGGNAQPNPGSQLERMLALWAIPQGFVKAAMANNATTKGAGGGATEVSFTVGGKYKMTGTISANGQVQSVTTWIEQPIVGDMAVVTRYTAYKDFGGVMFPSHILQTQDGFPSLDLTISAVTANPAFTLDVPQNVQSFTPPAEKVDSQKMADGVYYLTGSSHHSMVIEMKDYIVLEDVPLSVARASAVLAKAKELVPNKPIRYIVTSHHHWDHLGGIRTGMNEGATIITYQTNKAFLERVAKTQHTISPDPLSTSKKGAKVQGVGANYVITDGSRTIELHLLTGYEHTGDMMVLYLPKEQILAEPDAFTPPPQAGTPLARTAVPYAKALYDNIQRLKLNIKVICPLHGNRTTDVAEVGKAAGATGSSN